MSNPFPDRDAIATSQLEQLRLLLAAVLEGNDFYRRKYEGIDLADVNSLEQFSELCPITEKSECVADQETNAPFGTNLTFPLESYTRCHQTSGSTGKPLRWLDTNESWDWMLDNWGRVFEAAGVGTSDRIYFAFSFGPFLGFWTAFESALKIGSLCLPGGGLSSAARLRNIIEARATVLCCTPTYAIHLGHAAEREGIDLTHSAIKTIIVAGEPGGSLPSVRQTVSDLWNGARMFDHHGMTEVGPVTYECPDNPGWLHVVEGSYLTEILDGEALNPVEPGNTGELFLTTLGRTGSPLIRYRTGDLVKAVLQDRCSCGRCDLALDGGILGRADDMLVVRGVNIYPGAVDEIVRATGGIAEYQVRVGAAGAMVELELLIEVTDEADADGTAARLAKAFENSLSLRVPVKAVEANSLPRFEMKAKRWVRDGGE
ncbi:MAG: phenylacetate--CoA ligase [Verrucomicrobiales bacterium]|nr:phenylacetate--CoA ligase [Verrucomicrobiales bacterium]|tara:strand:+ start:52 stop:1341 length:1290 start_codon:yes stop_codon:yes gene_type:complete